MPFYYTLPRLVCCLLIALPVTSVTVKAGWAQTATAPENRALARISRDEIETASYNGGDLPPGQSALTAKVQILLDRSGISPGVVDGWRGGMSESAMKAFQRRSGLPITGRLDHAAWDLLQSYTAEPLTADYTITADDASGLVDHIPADYGEKAMMSSQGYTSILEKLAERFHMDDKFLAKLNPGVDFVPRVTIHVTVPAKPIRATVTRIIIDKQTRRVAAYDAKGRLVADYPATIGSDATPSPHGTHSVDAVALNPTYTYNPKRNFQQGQNDRVLTIPPGPNGPVGTVWIDLSQPTYGIHGTSTPSRLFVNQSYGCVRLTNWDAWELAHMVKSKVTTVEFLATGVSIADVTGGSATSPALAGTAPVVLAATRPPIRPLGLPYGEMTAQTDAPAPIPAATPAAAISAAQDSAAALAASVATQPAAAPVPVAPIPTAPIPGEPAHADHLQPAPMPAQQTMPTAVIPAPTEPLPMDPAMLPDAPIAQPGTVAPAPVGTSALPDLPQNDG